MVEGGAAEAQRDRHHRRADVRAPDARSRSSSSSRSCAPPSASRSARSTPKRSPADVAANASPALVDARSSRPRVDQREEGALRRATATLKKTRWSQTLTAELGAEKFARASRSSSRRSSRSASTHVVRELRARREASASTAATRKTIRPITMRGRAPAARARLGALPARRDAGDRHDDARHVAATSRRSTRSPARRWKRFMLHYNFPPLLDRRDQADARPRPSRDRSRRPRRARARPHAPGAGGVPVHDPHRRPRPSSRTARRSMAAVCGGCLSPHGRRRPDQGARSPASRWASSPRATSATPSSPTSSATRITSATWTSRSAAPSEGITAIQMDIKIAGLDRADPRAGARAGARGPPAHPRQDARDAAQRRARISSQYAPRITTLKVKPDQIRIIIGPGGKTIKGIVDQTGVRDRRRGRRHGQRRVAPIPTP